MGAPGGIGKMEREVRQTIAGDWVNRPYPAFS